MDLEIGGRTNDIHVERMMGLETEGYVERKEVRLYPTRRIVSAGEDIYAECGVSESNAAMGQRLTEKYSVIVCQ